MSENESVTTLVCKANMKRLEDRIDRVEAITEEIHNLTLSVERLTLTLQNTVKELDAHSNRLNQLESKDGEMWRTLVKYALTAVAGIVIGFAMKNVGF